MIGLTTWYDTGLRKTGTVVETEQSETGNEVAHESEALETM